MRSENYRKREAELKIEYENFLKTKEGQEWKDDWNKRYKDPDDIRDAGDFGDYLYDLHTEMLM